MTQETTLLTASGTFSAPANLISTQLLVSVVGGSTYNGASVSARGQFGATVSGLIPVSLLPLTIVIGSSVIGTLPGGNGFSGGGGEARTRRGARGRRAVTFSRPPAPLSSKPVALMVQPLALGACRRVGPVEAMPRILHRPRPLASTEPGLAAPKVAPVAPVAVKPGELVTVVARTATRRRELPVERGSVRAA